MGLYGVMYGIIWSARAVNNLILHARDACHVVT